MSTDVEIDDRAEHGEQPSEVGTTPKVEKTARTFSQFLSVALLAVGLGIGGAFASQACKDLGSIQDWPKQVMSWPDQVLAWRDKEFRKLIKIDEPAPDYFAEARSNTPDWDAAMKKGFVLNPQQMPQFQFQPQYIAPQPHTIYIPQH